ncbi:MAG: hypothetical protein BWY77_00651 [bacterium ADurb.Bin431]|nr:MAG: hypothetical protein BWY77_00651 [bacterium ADurb.Bin431]
MAPDLQAFIAGFGVAKVDGAGEKLLRSVDAPRRQQFLGADDPHQLALFTAEQVLAAVAAGEGEIGGVGQTLSGQVSQQSGVFVVGMGADVENTAEDVETGQGQLHLGAVGLTEGLGDEKGGRQYCRQHQIT